MGHVATSSAVASPLNPFRVLAGKRQTNPPSSGRGFAAVLIERFHKCRARSRLPTGQIAHGSVVLRTRGAGSRRHVHGAFSASNQKGARRNNVGVAHRRVAALRLAFTVAATGESGGGTSAKACLHTFLIQSMCPADGTPDQFGCLWISVVAPAWDSQSRPGSRNGLSAQGGSYDSRRALQPTGRYRPPR